MGASPPATGRRPVWLLPLIALAVVVGLSQLAWVAVRLASPGDDGSSWVDPEHWPAVVDDYLSALRDGDLVRAYDHVCHLRNRNPATLEEFVAHHRRSPRPAGWRLEWGVGTGRGGGRRLNGHVRFADGREATLSFAVNGRDDPGVCFVASADVWAREALDATPPSARRPWE